MELKSIKATEVVDIFTVVKGIPHLKIIDSGTAINATARLNMFKEKLELYRDVIESEEYQQGFESWRESTITLVSPNEPTDEMSSVRAIIAQAIDSDEVVEIAVKFKIRKRTLGPK